MDTKKMSDKEKIEYLKDILKQCVSVPNSLCYQTTEFSHRRLNYINTIATEAVENIDKL
jgi:hypothetical protein